MWYVVIHNSEPASNIEATERLLKILESTYVKSNLYKVDAAEFQIDKDQYKKLLIILTEFYDLLYGTLGKWDTTTVDSEAKPISKLFNDRY